MEPQARVRLRLSDVFMSINDPRHANKTRHDLVETLMVAVIAVLAGADNFVEIEAWANEKLEWFRRYLKLEHGIPSPKTKGHPLISCPPTTLPEQRTPTYFLPASLPSADNKGTPTYFSRKGTPTFFWVIDVVGLPDAAIAGMNVLWVGG